MIYDTLNPNTLICFPLWLLLITQEKKKLSCAKCIDLEKKKRIAELKECQHIVERALPCPPSPDTRNHDSLIPAQICARSGTPGFYSVGRPKPVGALGATGN